MRAALLLLLAAAPSTAAVCGDPPRFTARAGFAHEAYGFTGPGNGFSASLQDRSFHGWNAAAGADYQHRFRFDDLGLWAGAARRLPWGRSHAGFTVGGATRHVLLPAFRASGEGGLSLGRGFSADGKIEYRHYDDANVYIAAPVLAWEGRGAELSAGYTLSSAYYTSGGRSGGLSSYKLRAAKTGWCRVKPWAAYAYTKEPFEAGSGRGVASFTADHYSLGAELRLEDGLAFNGAYRREERRASGFKVDHYEAGAAYSWGGPP